MHNLLEPNDPYESPADILNRIDVPPASRSGAMEDEANVERRLLQDLRPISETIEWELSSAYWDAEGIRPFVRGEVPHVVNNSGWAAAEAAAVLFANCIEADPLPARIAVLELGAGLGLFALQLLDEFQRLCIEDQRDFYERLTYYVTDRSATSVRQWEEHQQFALHHEHVVPGRCDAMCPTTVETSDGGSIALPPLQAVFANYVLDSLPADVVRLRGDVVERLCVRTFVSGRRPASITVPDLEVDATDNATPLAGDVAALLPALPFLEFESEFQQIDGAELPCLAELLEYCDSPCRAILNHGAIECITTCIDRLEPYGFVLVNDFGPARRGEMEAVSVVQRFGGAAAAGINFPFLDHYFISTGRPVLTPEGDADRSIHSRLFTVQRLAHTTHVFLDRYSGHDHDQADRVVNLAAEHIAAGRFGEALACYRRALAYSPNDWHLLGKASELLFQQFQKNEEARRLAVKALAINPWHSAHLWNSLGNSLYGLHRREDAHQAYLQAQAIDRDDPQTNLNLAYTFMDFGDFGAALIAIARGLEHDATGQYQSTLIAKQRQIVDALSQHRHDLDQRARQRLEALSSVDDPSSSQVADHARVTDRPHADDPLTAHQS